MAACGAPLAAGAVHRPAVIALGSTVLGGLTLLWLSASSRGQGLRTGRTVVIPLVFLLIPCLQSVPLPFGARAILDPKGSAILANSLLGPRPTMPLSLDPPVTRARICEAAAALAIFIAAFHLASGSRRRHLLLRALGVTGVMAVIIGIGHRLLGANRIYGLFATSNRTPFTGPFINPNHSAEFLNLAAFVCLACSFQRPTIFNRTGWLVATCLCLGGSVATLSRGGAVSLAMGAMVFFFLRYSANDQEGGSRFVVRRTSLAWGGLVVGVTVLAAAAFGANDLLNRFHADHVGQDLRFRVWKDSLQVIRAHPFGIGRGAFDRVFPIYRTMKTNFAVRFAFVEDEPLQLLIDCGWVLFAACAASVGWAAWHIVRHGRRDRVEAALVAGLTAVVLHNCVDFGLEVPGVLLPFAAVLGSIMGRLPGHANGERWRRSPLIAATCAALVLGVASVAHASYDDFDALLKTSGAAADPRLLERAQRTHPTDYYYALAYARLLPLHSAAGPSPRFHALNRALALCPSCEQVHAEVARNLWALGLHRQSLQEWRTAASLQPVLLLPALGELHAGGARPAELASIATFDPIRLKDVAQYLSSLMHPDEGLVVLDQAQALGVAPTELYLLRARLQLQTGDTKAAAVTVAKAKDAHLRDPSLDVLEARLLIIARQSEGADQALAVLDRAAAQYPDSIEVQRARLALVTDYSKWAAADRSLEGLKRALSRTGGFAGEAHVAAARLEGRLSRWTTALDEYRIALADSPNDVGLWMEFGRAALAVGRNGTAREAFMSADHLSPNNPEIAKALEELDAQVQAARAGTLGR